MMPLLLSLAGTRPALLWHGQLGMSQFETAYSMLKMASALVRRSLEALKMSTLRILRAAFHRALYVKTASTRGGYVRNVSVANVHITDTMEAMAVLRNYSDPNPMNPHGFSPPP